MKPFSICLTCVIALLPTKALAQIRAGCSPNSVTVSMAESMSVSGIWEWICYAQNIGAATETLSVVGFALDFIELEQINQGDVIDIFTQKQQKSGWAKAANVAEAVGVGALIVLGQGYVAISARGVADVGLAGYAATKVQPLLQAKEPSISNAIAGMLTGDQVLQPGTGISWKVYASNTGSPIGPNQLAAAKRLGRGARLKPMTPSLGPKILTNRQAHSSATSESPRQGTTTEPAVYEQAAYSPQLAEVQPWDTHNPWEVGQDRLVAFALDHKLADLTADRDQH